jgi:hypothetical protein
MADLCHFRNHRECACPAGSCQQEVKTPAPVVVPVWRDFITCLAFWAVVAGIAIGTGYALQQQNHQYELQARV